MEPGEVDITSIHDVKAASFEGDPVENVDIVELAIGNMDEGRMWVELPPSVKRKNCHCRMSGS